MLNIFIQSLYVINFGYRSYFLIHRAEKCDENALYQKSSEQQNSTQTIDAAEETELTQENMVTDILLTMNQCLHLEMPNSSRQCHPQLTNLPKLKITVLKNTPYMLWHYNNVFKYYTITFWLFFSCKSDSIEFQ